MYIEIEKYADFDVPTTDCIIECPDSISINSLLKEFYSLYNLQNEGYNYDPEDVNHTIMVPVIYSYTKGGDTITRLKNHDKYPDLFKKFLLKKGFKKIKTNKVSFSD